MSSLHNIKLAVDAVVFGYTSSEGLSVLLIKRSKSVYKGSWALPGGLVEDDETLEQAVLRELEEETGVQINYLEQLYTFGDINRDPRNRVISVAYFGLVKPTVFTLHTSNETSDVQWFPVKDIPKLVFDHSNILHTAMERLKAKIRYEPIGFELLDAKFPFSELEKLYTAVLDRPIDRRNFKKKILKFGFLEETSEKQKMEGSGRPGNLFKFNKDRYFQLKKEGIAFEV